MINFPFCISAFCSAAIRNKIFDLLMRCMGYALVTTTIIASTLVRILLLGFFVSICSTTHIHLKEFKIFIKMRRGLLFLTSLPLPRPPPLLFSTHHWQQVCVNTSIKLDSWPAGSDKRKEVFEPGKKDDVHFGVDGKTVPVVIAWPFGVL